MDKMKMSLYTFGFFPKSPDLAIITASRLSSNTETGIIFFKLESSNTHARYVFYFCYHT